VTIADGEVFCLHIINKDINKREESSSEVLLFFLIIPQKYLSLGFFQILRAIKIALK